MGMTSKIALTVASSAVGALMLAGGSFAMFSDQVGPQMKQFTAGTVKISPSESCPLGYVNLSNLEPGDTQTGTITLANTGSLDEWVGLDTLLSHSGTAPDIFSGTTPLAISYDVQIFQSGSNSPMTGSEYSGASDYQTQDKNVNWFATGSTSTFNLASEGTVQTDTFFLPSGYSATVTYTISFPSGAGNSYQGATGMVSMGAASVQASNNIDFSSGVGVAPNTYPTTMTFPSAMSVSSPPSAQS